MLNSNLSPVAQLFVYRRNSRIALAMARSRIVRGIERLANCEKLSLFRGLFRILNATMFDAVPTGVAIPPIPVPMARAQARGAIGRLTDMRAITGTNTVARGTLSTNCESNAATQRTSVTVRARLPPDN